MIKNIITITSLLAAGIICANAATFTTTPPNDSSTNRGNDYYGFAANFTNSTIGQTTSSDGTDFSNVVELYLQQLNLYVRDTDGSVGSSFKIAVYKWINDSDTPGTFLGLSENSVTPTSIGQKLEFTFNNIELGASNATYQFLFVNETVSENYFITGNLEEYQHVSIGANITVFQDSGTTNIPQGSGIYTSNSLNAWGGQWIPKYELYTTDTLNVPEPSAFGLLAGLGALALVGARRRRSRK